MALDLNDPFSQYFEWGTTSYSDDVFIPGYCTVVGYITSGAFEATSDHINVQLSRDDFSVLHGAATWITTVDYTKAHVEFPVDASAAISVMMLPDHHITGPYRMRLQIVTGAEAGVNQDGQIIYPIIRDRRRG
jgi:hypothetical protein